MVVTQPVSMQPEEVLARRMTTQLLQPGPATDAAAVVGRLTCVQSQEHAHALWSLGMRCGTDARALGAAFDRGDFLRTHVLRPTWHFVVPEDVGWILALTAPRVHRRNARMYRDTGVPEAIAAGALDVVQGRIADRGPATRAQLATALAEHGIEASGLRLVHLVMHAELDGILASGPMAGTQHTYALLRDTAPAGRSPEDPEAELAFRFFSGHGPASVEDYLRWSSTTKTSTRSALQRLGDRLERVVCEEHELWFDPTLPFDPTADADGVALLLPLFDELTLTYPRLGFPAAGQHPHPPGEDRYGGTVVVGRRDVGLWRRTVRAAGVEVDTTVAPGVTARERAAVAAAVGRLQEHLVPDPTSP